MARQYGTPAHDPSLEPIQAAIQNKKNVPEVKKPDPYPSAQDVLNAHKNSDVDNSETSQHHTLGPESYQASPGDHTHDGGNSPLLLSGYTLNGVKANPGTVLPSIIQCLARLGATDATT